jgi:hypothetical protein
VPTAEETRAARLNPHALCYRVRTLAGHLAIPAGLDVAEPALRDLCNGLGAVAAAAPERQLFASWPTVPRSPRALAAQARGLLRVVHRQLCPVVPLAHHETPARVGIAHHGVKLAVEALEELERLAGVPHAATVKPAPAGGQCP